MKVRTGLWQALLWSVLLVFFPVTVSGAAALRTQENVFPQLVLGSGWECEIVLIAQGADWSSGLILFFDQAGTPMPVSVNGGSPETFHTYSLLYRSSETFLLTGSDQVRIGFAVVTQVVPGNTDTGAVAGLLTYRYREGGSIRVQIGVPAAQSLSGAHVPFDNTSGNRTALALVALSRGPVEVSRYSVEGRFEESGQFDWDGYSQTAQFVDEIFPASLGQRGFLTLRSGEHFQLLVLDQNGLLLSTSAAFPAVIEREVVLRFTDTTHWELRLVWEGEYLHGIAERQNPPDIFHVTGVLMAQTIQLNIHGVIDGSALNFCLLSRGNSLLRVEGGVAVAIRGDDGFWGQGTWDMYPLSSAQF